MSTQKEKMVEETRSRYIYRSQHNKRRILTGSSYSWKF